MSHGELSGGQVPGANLDVAPIWHLRSRALGHYLDFACWTRGRDRSGLIGLRADNERPKGDDLALLRSALSRWRSWVRIPPGSPFNSQPDQPGHCPTGVALARPSEALPVWLSAPRRARRSPAARPLARTHIDHDHAHDHGFCPIRSRLAALRALILAALTAPGRTVTIPSDSTSRSLAAIESPLNSPHSRRD
jgi:hypothetical protein